MPQEIADQVEVCPITAGVVRKRTHRQRSDRLSSCFSLLEARRPKESLLLWTHLVEVSFDYLLARLQIWCSDAGKEPRIHHRRGPYPGARHWCKYGDLLGRQFSVDPKPARQGTSTTRLSHKSRQPWDG